MEIQLPSDIDLHEILSVRKYIYVPVVTVVAVVVLVSSVIVPHVKKVTEARRQVGMAKSELSLLEDKVTALEAIDEQAVSEQIDRLERVLPSDKNVFSLLVSLTGLAAENSVSLESFDISPGSIASESATPSALPAQEVAASRQQGERKQNLETLSATFTIFGDFSRVEHYLTQVERLQPLVKLGTIKLAPLERRSAVVATESGVPVIVDVQLDFFYAPLPEQLGTISDPLVAITETELALYESFSDYFSYDAQIPSTLVIGKEDLFSGF